MVDHDTTWKLQQFRSIFFHGKRRIVIDQQEMNKLKQYLMILSISLKCKAINIYRKCTHLLLYLKLVKLGTDQVVLTNHKKIY